LLQRIKKLVFQLENSQLRSSTDLKNLQENLKEKVQEMQNLRKERDELSQRHHTTNKELEIRLAQSMEKEKNLQEELLRQKGTHENVSNESKKENENLRRAGLQVSKDFKDLQIKYDKEKKEWSAQKAELDQTSNEATESLRQEKQQVTELLEQTNSNYEKDKKEWERKEKTYHERITEQKDQNDTAISELQSIRSSENSFRKKFNELEVKHVEEVSKINHLNLELREKKNLEYTIQQLKSALETAETKLVEIPKLENLQKSTLEGLQTKEAERKKLSDEKEQLNTQLIQNSKKLNEHQKRVVELETHLAEMNKENASLKNNNKNLTENLQQSESKTANLNENATKQITQLQLKNEQLNKIITENTHDIENLQSSIQRTKQDLQLVMEEKKKTP